MARRESNRKIWIALLATLALSWVVSGCGEYNTRFKEIVRPLSLSFAFTYTSQGTDITVTYSIPPPEPGKVYVLWAYDQGRRQVVKLGAIPHGIERTAKGSANFPAVGVIITQETSPNVTRMEGTGIIELELDDQNLGPTTSGTRTSPRR